MLMLMHAKPKVIALITQTIADVVSKIIYAPAVITEIVTLVTYIQDIFLRREVVKQRIYKCIQELVPKKLFKTKYEVFML